MLIDEVKEKNRILINNKLGHIRSISNGDRWDYQEMIRIRFPKHWENIYKNKWPIRFVYYDHNNTVSLHQFYLNRHSNMHSILNIFAKYLECQKLAINNCFGNDIAEIIINYLPTSLSDNDIIDNSIYVNARFWKDDRILQHSIYVPPHYSINKLHGKLNLWGGPTLSRYTILRLRAIKAPSRKRVEIPITW